jgi:hypothetical protein
VVDERGSDKHGRLLDEELKHEVEGIVRSGHSTHAEEWSDPEPSAEGDPDVDLAPHGSLTGGVPAGITSDEVTGRSELAQHLPPSAFPATAQALRAYAEENHAPARILGLLEQAPADQEFPTVGALWAALGGGREERP